ncbi:Uncharacterized membrane protein [Chitinophaga terrae (ex Kim and Jung 2007)]|uniref:Uncharacterized membrane protein n=1 Tax=Chitinophaga terrae (ex Kim and Jung 2007) TaxID=408074 RepID=A0A1H4DR19_9BACT|nr:DUF1634 domain-containing protein [Chitinophaga terrae (ex Kim and Jung 2007)]GEP91092.1 membrane protein [Chitinophaga terrae (ex Kim and Jung 2007)]SEA75213.1 Uncharacterized membrane protein [Chitinophaga terrae (ex Kim and Jung 2007)]
MKQLLSKLKDKDIQQLIGKQLRFGVIISSIIVTIGGVIYLVRHGHENPSYRTFTGVREGLNHLPGIWQGVLENRGMNIIQLGIVLLIATPIIRIVFSVIAFFIEKDYLYVFITLLVLGIITYSMLGGLAG